MMMQSNEITYNSIIYLKSAIKQKFVVTMEKWCDNQSFFRYKLTYIIWTTMHITKKLLYYTV